jgi:hypothetical protein
MLTLKRQPSKVEQKKTKKLPTKLPVNQPTLPNLVAKQRKMIKKLLLNSAHQS